MRSIIATLLLASASIASGAAALSGDTSLDLTALSIEELMDIEVTSVSRKPEKITRAAAAVAVLTRDDLRRAGVTSIPEALRLVPGVHVAHFDANKWAISIRGFNSLFADKLLVLIDGRSVYNPMYSGVFWEIQDLLLVDVERIEVIRGPGATLWGANAVNGVINIITRRAVHTQGSLVHIGFGTQERRFGDFRYGGRLGEKAFYRVFARYFDRDRFVYASGKPADDAWNALRGGFRLDWDLADDSALQLQGDVFNCDQKEKLYLASLEPPYANTPVVDARFSGGYLLGRWERAFSEDSDIKLQLYYHHPRGKDELQMDGVYDELDVDFQHRLRYGAHQEIVWGAAYRLTWDELHGGFSLQFRPGKRTYHLFSAFVQNDLALVPEQLRLTLGSKFEHNAFSGFEVQPSLRLLWTPEEHHVAWGAISRAVRTPARAAHPRRYVRQVIPGGALGADTPPTFVMPMGTREFESEELLALETGYRLRPTDRLFLDLATFFNIYDKLRTYETSMPFFEEDPLPPHIVFPLYEDNKMFGRTYGAELAADWMALDGWRLHAAYSYLKMDLRVDDDSQYTFADDTEGESPQQQFFLRSSLDLPGKLELDGDIRYVDDLPSLSVESYLELDFRLGWRLAEGVALSLVGQNLLHSHHPEHREVAIPFVATEVKRGLYTVLTLSF